MSTLRDEAVRILTRLRQAGHLAYWVGGCVRDRLLGAEPRDYDIVTDATPQQMHSLFPHTIPVGAAFGTVLVVADSHHVEVSTFRGRERTALAAPDDPAELIRADVAHRDFTINALAADPETDRLFDFVEGRADLDRKLIRAVGDPRRRFHEDPLRLVRAVRFAAQLGFTIEPVTEAAIRALASDATLASPERIHQELLAILLSPRPTPAFRLLHDTGLLHALLPEVAAMEGVAQPPEFHPEGDVWTHTLLMLEHLSQVPGPSPELALAVLLHDVGKPLTFRVADRIRFDRHCEVGVALVEAIAARYRWSGAQTERVSALVRDHLTFLNARAMRRSTLVRWLRQPHFPELLELYRLDCLSSHGSLDIWEFCRDQHDALPPEQIRPPRLLTGEDLKALGYPPGPRYKEILAAVEDAQLEGALRTPEAARAWVREHYPLA